MIFNVHGVSEKVIKIIRTVLLYFNCQEIVENFIRLKSFSTINLHTRVPFFYGGKCSHYDYRSLERKVVVETPNSEKGLSAIHVYCEIQSF